jgi:hypothetical protein
MVDRLVGLQAQEPRDPYLALWSRIVDFDPAGLDDPEPRGIGHVLVDGQVRATWWRTKHGREGPTEISIRHDGLPKRHLAAVEAEAARALPILAQGASDARVIVTRRA